MEPAYRYRAVCARVVDGDSVILRIDLGFRVSTEQSIRLRGVNCPELNTPEGKAARAFVVLRLLPEGLPPQPLVVESYRGQQTFARYVADVWLPGGYSLAELLIDAGHGVAA